MASTSDSQDTVSVIDRDFLLQFLLLDLSGKVTHCKHAIGRGAHSEVFKGTCQIGGHGDLDVAVKRLRFQLSETGYELASFRLSPFCNPANGSTGIQERNICVVQAKAPKYFGVTRLCILSRYGIPFAHIQMDASRHCLVLYSTTSATSPEGQGTFGASQIRSRYCCSMLETIGP